MAIAGARVVTATSRAVVVERLIPGVSAAEAFAAVSDVNRMRDWSPEGRGRSDATGALRVGDSFVGTNRRGRRRWSTACTVSVVAPPGEFAFDVAWAGLPVARWAYAFEDVEGGVQVTETWTDDRSGPKGMVVKLAGLLASGVWDRSAHNAESMKATLDRLAAALTAGS
ncbi:MAG: SRPBCC family protein [Actinomycetota bacterium]|nr:SRPBCC family protein [Actinomycetota bacterium]